MTAALRSRCAAPPAARAWPLPCGAAPRPRERASFEGGPRLMLARAPTPAARLARAAMGTAKRPRAAAATSEAAPSKSSSGLWLLKSEPDERFEKGVKVSCSAADLEALGPAGCAWEGVRNFGARNALRLMKDGDRCLLQHTGKAAAVVAVLRVTREAYAEEAQFDAAGPCAPQSRKHAAAPKPFAHALTLLLRPGIMTLLRRALRRVGAPLTSRSRRG
jgi:hypothetical protein